MDVIAIVAVVSLNLIVFLTGLVFVRRFFQHDSSECVLHESMLLAGRQLNIVLVLASLIGTWFSGNVLFATIETLSTNGLIHTPMLWGFPITLFIGGWLIVGNIRQSEHVTILDSAQHVYGNILGGVLFIPAFIFEFMWGTMNLIILCNLLEIITEERFKYIVIFSSILMVCYTSYGGFYSIVCSSTSFLLAALVAMGIYTPYAASNTHVMQLLSTKHIWLGSLQADEVGVWLDQLFMIVFGLLVCQSYCQHFLALRVIAHARRTSFIAAFICIVLAIPVTFMGVVSASADWTALLSNNSTQNISVIARPASDVAASFQHLVPFPITVVALCMVAALVLSSADSSVFSACTMFTHNIYHVILRQKASSRELNLVLRISLAFLTVTATLLALFIQADTFKQYWLLTFDFTYVLLFPQIFSAVVISDVNEYGSITALLIGLALRICCGIPEIGLIPLIQFPYFDVDEGIHLFPFRTIIMLLSLFLLVTVSRISATIWSRNHKPISQDEIDIIRISYREPTVERVTSFSKIASWSGSYNSITASANDLRHSKEERLLLKATLNRSNSRAKEESRNSYLL